MEIVKRRNEGIEKMASGGPLYDTSTPKLDAGVSPSTEPLTSHEYVRSSQSKGSLNAIHDDLLHAPSLYEKANESSTSVNVGTSLQSPAFDLSHDNLSDDIGDDHCLGSPVEIGFDQLRQGHVQSRSPDLSAIQEEDEREIHDLDKELEARMASCSFDTDEEKDNKLQSGYNLEDRLELNDKTWTPLEPSITRWSDEDMLWRQGDLSASDLARRLVEVKKQRERQMEVSKVFWRNPQHNRKKRGFKYHISKALEKLPSSTKMKMNRLGVANQVDK
ncbi:hypothetical protein BELL_0030g00150 [Botrytis elliptica]|uniref:Uncharacterized protein n=1 Tax=Botrytis elliptica TaxID=278938 RepID=A0A4Z1JZX6_9HELO|nr:hypothetical protein EAE99_004280 [Botrytis elliptica]TGO79511.1 hypothetical protein BELL_0030g00150 [Botrytis elliptica]